MAGFFSLSLHLHPHRLRISFIYIGFATVSVPYFLSSLSNSRPPAVPVPVPQEKFVVVPRLNFFPFVRSTVMPIWRCHIFGLTTAEAAAAPSFESHINYECRVQLKFIT